MKKALLLVVFGVLAVPSLWAGKHPVPLEAKADAAAKAVGDDHIQASGGGGVHPDSFTHGTSEQRVRWFKRGYETGDLRQCDTFNADDL